MKAILLSAGFGNRLRPLTKKIPKCLVPIKGIPLLEIWLKRLIKINLGPFIVNTHYLKEQVENFINLSPFRNKVSLVYEPKLLGTAGTLMENIDFFGDDDGLLVHADNYCMADFSEFIKAHKNRPPECLMTMMCFQTDTPKTCGILEVDGDNIVRAIHEKVENPPGSLANGAVYILSNQLIRLLKKENNPITDFSLEVLPRLLGQIYTYETKEFFIDIGTIESYTKANTVSL